MRSSPPAPTSASLTAASGRRFSLVYLARAASLSPPPSPLLASFHLAFAPSPPPGADECQQRRLALHLFFDGDESVRGARAVTAILAPEIAAAAAAPLPVARPLAPPPAASPTHPLPCLRSLHPPHTPCRANRGAQARAAQSSDSTGPWRVADSQTMLAWVDRDLELYMALSPLAVPACLPACAASSAPGRAARALPASSACMPEH